MCGQTLLFIVIANGAIETAVLAVHNSLVCALDDKHVSLLLLLDLSAAFDTVDHYFLSILEHRFCIRGLALDWFKSYFND